MMILNRFNVIVMVSFIYIIYILMFIYVIYVYVCIMYFWKVFVINMYDILMILGKNIYV